MSYIIGILSGIIVLLGIGFFKARQEAAKARAKARTEQAKSELASVISLKEKRDEELKQALNRYNAIKLRNDKPSTHTAPESGDDAS